jgi:UDP-N-acetyl-alpha-D-muramoyl-L-alanyl-L-glutamate epimerase
VAPTSLAVETFRFTHRSLDPEGLVRLGYALDDITFEETFQLPKPTVDSSATEQLLDLLHWVAGVSYYKAAIPPRLAFETGSPPLHTTQLLKALYSEGLGEFAVVNNLEDLPRPDFAVSVDVKSEGTRRARATHIDSTRLLIPVGGGKDSAVAIEIARASGIETALFSVGDATPIRETANAAKFPRHIVTRKLDPRLIELNAAGALNGHIPITAIISCVALLTAASQGFDAVALANERSASAGNFLWHGIEVNHQFSKSLAAERLLSAAVAETGAPVRQFSVLRPASELAIARAFAGMAKYHGAFTSCNAIFRIDPALRAASWCRDCPKCRFVFLAMAPFSTPAHLREVFGLDLLDDEGQYEGFALLAADGGHKPWECVGEEQESLAAMRLLAADPAWREHVVVRRLAAELLPGRAPSEGDPVTVLALGSDHDVPPALLEDLGAVLGA